MCTVIKLTLHILPVQSSLLISQGVVKVPPDIRYVFPERSIFHIRTGSDSICCLFV